MAAIVKGALALAGFAEAEDLEHVVGDHEVGVALQVGQHVFDGAALKRHHNAAR